MGNELRTKIFLEYVIAVKGALHCHFEHKQSSKHFLMYAPIVNLIVSNKFWDPAIIEGSTSEKMMTLLGFCANHAVEQQREDALNWLSIVTENRIKLYMSARHREFL